MVACSCIRLSFNTSVCYFVFLSANQSVYLPACKPFSSSFSLFSCLSTSPHVCQYICLHVCVRVPIHLSTFLSCLSVGLSAGQLFCLSITLSMSYGVSTCLSVCNRACLFCLSDYMFVRANVCLCGSHLEIITTKHYCFYCNENVVIFCYYKKLTRNNEFGE